MKQPPATILTPAKSRVAAFFVDLLTLRRDPLYFLSEIVNREGDCVSMNLGLLKVCILNHPDAIQHVLQSNHQNYSKETFQYNLLADITGNGLLTSDGDLWLRQRRLIQPAFHRRYFSSWGEIIYSSTSKMMDRWEAQIRRGAQPDIEAEMMDLALDIVYQALFGVDELDTRSEVIESTLTVLDHIVFRARNPFSLPQAVPSRRNRRFQEALSRLDAAVSQIINRHKQRAAEPSLDGSEPANVIDLLLRSNDNDSGEGMSEKQLRDEIVTLLIAGHETVASALTWSIYVLSRSPEVQMRLREEARRILAMRNSAPLPQIPSPLTHHIFAEALRLFPPAWIITRRAIKPDIITLQQPFFVPAGALVVISPYLIHRHPDYWENPHAFLPDRFDDPDLKKRHRFAYIPFGGGPRLCIGEGMALLEGQLILPLLIQRFSFSSPDQLEILPDPAVTLRPKHGLRVKVSPLSLASHLRRDHGQ